MWKIFPTCNARWDLEGQNDANGPDFSELDPFSFLIGVQVLGRFPTQSG